MFKPVSSKTNFPELERDVLRWWKETDAFNKLRQLRAGSKKWSFVDGPITANNPMGVHHAWGRTYKDIFQRYKAMQGFDQRWQNGFDCQGLWVEVNVEKDLGFKSKRDIEAYGLAPFVILCKQRVLNYSAVQTEQSVRLGMWMDWNNPDTLRMLSEKLGENPNQVIELDGPHGRVRGTVEQIVAQLGLPQLGGSYFTFSDENNYLIWAFIKKCAENGWLYKGTDVMPWCARCGTGVSEHEISTEDYPDLTHPSITARLPLRNRKNEYLLVWTTTPWTLTSNVAVAVGPELTYLKVKQGNDVYYLSEGTTKMLKGDYQVLDKLKGAAMEGWTYDGPFDELPAQQIVGGYAPAELRNHIGNARTNSVQAHRVILWKDVGDAEGTGLVHIAPGCGAEDFHLGKEFGLPVVAPIDENGGFIENFGEFSGMSAFDVAPRVIESLTQKGLLYRAEDYTHRYPTCWRCKTELLFRLVDEWFISMGETYAKPREQLTREEKARSLRYQIMDVVDQIRWIPQFGYDREMDWLCLMHDWMISKKRYWGLALPIWECVECGHANVIGSRDELQTRAVAGWDKFNGHTPHRPFIDEVKIKCEKCGGKTSRIKDVGNPWLDAGIVTMSTMGYRTDRKYWEQWYPADFITESFPGQFRNWFYSVLAMGTAMTGQPPFKALMGYGTLFAEDGRPMHKSSGNMIEFNEAAETIGADVMRWMFARTRYETNMLFGYHVADETRRMFLLPLWNVYSFFVTYANLDKWSPANRQPSTVNQLDRWILARLQALIVEMTPALDNYDSPTAARAVEPFIDDLSNWYLRRSRRRFWKSEDDDDKHAAYATLYEVLVALTKLLAPFIPFTAEAMYQNLVRSVDANAPESVHHCEWLQVDESKFDKQLLNDMAIARQVVNLGHSIRAAKSIKVRQPLARAIVVADAAQRESLTHLRDLVADELNVKSVEYATREEELVTYQVRPNFQTLSPKVQKLFPDPATDDKVAKKHVRDARKSFIVSLQQIIDTFDSAYWAENQRLGKSFRVQNLTSFMSGGKGIEFIGGVDFEFEPNDILVTPQPKPGFAVASEGTLVVALDTTLTEELVAEGLVREFVRRVQDLRKSADFDISDRIRVYYAATPKLASAIEMWREYISGETLADELKVGQAPVGAASVEDGFDGEKVTVAVVKK
jgi:isoleucyl-tRNA synthetase